MESVAQFGSVLAQRTYVYELPGHVLGVVQNFLTHNALAIVLSVMLMRADVKLPAPDDSIRR